MRAYENLKFYQNICEIRRKVYQLTEKFAKTNLRLVGQMRDAARSAKQNIREGYSKDSVGDFAHSIKISRGSLEELEGDIDDIHEDGLIDKTDYKELKDLVKITYLQIDTFGDKPQCLTLGSQSRKPEGLNKTVGLSLSVSTLSIPKIKYRKQAPMLVSHRGSTRGAIGVYECVDRYIDSLYKLDREGKWKIRFKRNP